KNPVAPLIWEDFESGSDSEELIGWSFAGNHPQYSNTILRNTQSLLSGRMNTAGATYNSTAYRRLGNKHKIYSSMNFYIERVSGPPSWNMKMFRMTAGYPGYKDGVPSMSITLNHPSYGGSFANYVGGSQRPNQAGMGEWAELSWQRWEYYLKVSDPIETPTGTMQFWSDGEKRIYWDEILTMASGATQVDGEYVYIDAFDLPFYMANSSTTAGDDGPNEYTVYYDDVYVDDTPARVEICSGANWWEKGNCEIQIPSAWNNSSITFTAKQGNFADGATAYLYVVDESDTVNQNGFSITFGEAPLCVPSAEICDNGLDEDCDNLIDCNDSDCDGTPECPSCTPTTEICGDGIDQDCDGEDLTCPPGRCDQETIEFLLEAPVISLINSNNGLACGGITDESTPRILMRGTTGQVSEAFSYEYDTDVTVNNDIRDLLPSQNYDIIILNLDNGQSNTLSQSSNSSGELTFNAAIIEPPPAGTPQIISAPSTLTHNVSFTISGENFGTKSPAVPLVWDDFEAGTVGGTVPGSYPVIGPQWSGISVDPQPSYTDTKSHAESQAALIQWQQYSISAFNTRWDPTQEIYISYWRYMEPQVPEELPTNHKQFYVFGNFNASGENPAYGRELNQLLLGAIMPTRPHWQLNVQNQPVTNFPFSNGVTRLWSETINLWQRWEVYGKLNNPYTESNGELKAWVNGQQTFSDTGLVLRNVDGKWYRIGLGYMYGGYHPGGTDRSYFDNVYIDNTQARIELCNVSSWTQKNITGGKCEIQIPFAWSTESITFTANQGTFTTGQTAYLYVIDSEGNVSNGYPVSFS
ncbi:MAG: putative metal-binding motif-containing protein, partial [Candidatus Diapherotrites archaeon]